MNRGCVWCKMRDAILGCMGGQPKREKLPKGDYPRRSYRGEYSRAGDSDKQFVFDDTGLQGDLASRSQRCSQGRQVRRQPREYSKDRGQGRSLSRDKKQAGTRQKIDQYTQTYGHYYKKINFGKKKHKTPPHLQSQGRRDSDHERRTLKSSYCDFYQKQYERDLLKRRAERLPLLQYQYEEGRPLRSILKKPQFVRTPRMDELIVVEVCTAWLTN